MLTNSRGLALAVMLCGSGIASSITPLLTNALINALGWRGAYVAPASLFAVVVFPVLWFFFFDLRRTSTRETSVPLSGWTVCQGLRFRQFYKLLVAALLITSIIVGLGVHLVPILCCPGWLGAGPAELLGELLGGE